MDMESRFTSQESITMANGYGEREMDRVKLFLLMAHTMKVSSSKIDGMGTENTFKKMALKISVNGQITCAQELFK